MITSIQKRVYQQRQIKEMAEQRAQEEDQPKAQEGWL